MSIPTRKIGQAAVSEIGFGAMGISSFYGAVESDEERFKVCHPEHQRGAVSLISLFFTGFGRCTCGRVQSLGYCARIW
jgi:hypothetical protein